MAYDPVEIAIMEERERCAAVARKYGVSLDSDQSLMAAKIAQEILFPSIQVSTVDRVRCPSG